MAEETLSVGPFALNGRDWLALHRVTGVVTIVDRLNAGFFYGLASAAFIFLFHQIVERWLSPYIGAGEDASIAAIVAGGVLFLLYFFAMRARTARRAVRGQGLDRPRVISISAAGVEARVGGIHSTYAWLEIERIVTTRGHVILVLSPLLGLIMPVRAFATKEAAVAFGEKARAWRAAA
jgi:YcxB-like protein